MRSARLFPAVLVLALPTLGLADYNTSYTVTHSDYAISNIFLAERGDGFGSGTWAFSVPQTDSDYTITNPFPTSNLPTESLLIGIAHDLPNDAPGQKHLVLFMDDYAASLSNHIAWGTLFRHTDEDQLISDLELATSGQDWSVIQPGLDGLSRFNAGYDDAAGHHAGDAEVGILDNQGTPRSAWFAPNGTFSIVAWSNGTIIGGGTTSSTQAVPEPSAFAALAVGGIALLRRRRRH